MTWNQANLLRAFSLWTAFVWCTRIVNIIGDDHPVGFKVVHSVLALVSVAFAVATWVIVARVRRGARRRSAERLGATAGSRR